VSFAAMSEAVYFQRYDESEHDAVWYRGDEYRNIRLDTKRAVERAHRLQRSSRAAGAGSAAVAEDLVARCELTGIENLLSVNIINKTRKTRAQCLEAVLEEQARQRRRGVCDPERLAAAARDHTQWSGKRAHTIALLQAR